MKKAVAGALIGGIAAILAIPAAGFAGESERGVRRPESA